MTDAKHSSLTRAEQHAATHAELIRLGLERFPIKGYEATSIDDIVSGTGISRPNWYYHFGDKAEYFLQVIAARTAPRGDWWEVARDPAITTAHDAITLVMRGFKAADPEYGAWILTLVGFWRAERDNPAHAELLRELYEGYISEIANFIDILKERGMSRSAKPSRQLAAAILAMREGALTHVAVYGAQDVVDVDLICALVGAEA